MFTPQVHLSEETGIRQRHILQNLQNPGCKPHSFKQKGTTKECLSSVSLTKAGTARPIFIKSFSKIFQEENTKLCLSYLCQALTTSVLFSVHSLDHPCFKVSILFYAMLPVTVKQNGLPSSLLQPFKITRFTTSLPSLSTQT